MHWFCSHCAKDEVLRDYIQIRGTRADRCDVCGRCDVNAVNGDDAELRCLVRALVRYHYSEWCYNGHFGGESLEAMLASENEITNVPADCDQEVYEALLLGFFDEAYEDYDKGVSLFAGYDDSGQRPLLQSIKLARSPAIVKLEHRLRSKNHFLLESEIDDLLRPYKPKLSVTLPEGGAMFRARIGTEMNARSEASWGEERHYKPYSAELLGAPPPPLAGSGRLNRPGVSFLYLATNEDTAICEVRPHPGHYVSVGTFNSAEPICVADFTSISIRSFYGSDKLLDDFLLLTTIDQEFGLPVVPEDRDRYSLTQFLSDSLRRLGFQGVLYRSSVGAGSNLAVFDSTSFQYVAGSAKTVHVSHVKYTYSVAKAMGSREDYIYDEKGDFL